MSRGGDYKQQQHQGARNYNKDDEKSSVGGLSGRQVYAMNTLTTLPRVPAIAPPGYSNRSGYSDSIDRDQCITRSTSYQQSGN